MDDNIDTLIDQANLPPELQDLLLAQGISFEKSFLPGFLITGIALPVLLLSIFWIFYLLRKRRQAALGLSAHYDPVAAKRYWMSLSLCGILGSFGVHRFYLGRWVSGFFMLITLGGLGIWQLWDLYLITMGRFRDGNGVLIVAP